VWSRAPGCSGCNSRGSASTSLRVLDSNRVGRATSARHPYERYPAARPCGSRTLRNRSRRLGRRRPGLVSCDPGPIPRIAPTVTIRTHRSLDLVTPQEQIKPTRSRCASTMSASGVGSQAESCCHSHDLGPGVPAARASSLPAERSGRRLAAARKRILHQAVPAGGSKGRDGPWIRRYHQLGFC
jgi:hypothetical protein